MRFLRTSHTVMTMLLVLGLSGLSQGAEQDKKAADKGVMHTIDARVTYSSGTTAGTNVLAERQPGYFKVPAGQVARHFKYYFVDPKSGIERDKLNNSTIYCETTKQWVKIPADPATLELPPGDYKFVVGGTPGASGTLNFRTFTSSGANPPPQDDGKPKPPIRRPPTEIVVDTTKPPTVPPRKGEHPTSVDLENRAKELVDKGWKPPELNPGEAKAVIPLNCTIELMMWHPADPGKNRSSVTLEISEGKATGRVEKVFPESNTSNAQSNSQTSEMRVTDEYAGSLQDSRIRGIMKTKSGPSTLKIFNRDTGKLTTDYVYTASAEAPFSFEFRADGTMLWECTRTSMTSHTHFNVGTDGEGKTDITRTSGPETIAPEYRVPGYGVWRLRK